jgi:hypothetical protein
MPVPKQCAPDFTLSRKLVGWKEMRRESSPNALGGISSPPRILRKAFEPFARSGGPNGRHFMLEERFAGLAAAGRFFDSLRFLRPGKFQEGLS